MFGKDHLFLMWTASYAQMLGEGLYGAYPSLDGCTYRTLTFEGEISRKSISGLAMKLGESLTSSLPWVAGKSSTWPKWLPLKVAPRSSCARRSRRRMLPRAPCPSSIAMKGWRRDCPPCRESRSRSGGLQGHRKRPNEISLGGDRGPALSTYYEGESNWKTGRTNYVWCQSEQAVGTAAGRAIARACMENAREGWSRCRQGMGRALLRRRLRT